MKKNIFRAVAILTCFSILTLAVPGAIAAEKKAKNVKLRVLDHSIIALSSILPFFSPIYDTGKDITLPESNNNTVKKIKITDGVTKPKPPDGD